MTRHIRDGRVALAGATCVAALLGAAALSSLSCSGPTVSAFGEIDDVVIVAGSTAAGRAVALLDDALSAEGTWLLGEEHFKTHVVGIRELGDYTYRRNLVILGTWEDSEAARVVNSRVGGIAEGDRPRPRSVEDIWGEGQVVTALMADSEKELVEYISSNGEDVVAELVDAIRTRLARKLEEELESTGFDAEMRDRFGWSLGPPAGYGLHTSKESEGLVFFRKTAPDRTIFVHWEQGAPGDVTDEFMIEKRNEIGALYFDGDAVERRRELVFERTELAGLPALRMSGWWGNRELIGGGPFRSYCVHVPWQGRTYMVDAALFAPADDKTPLMRNLDAALQTFRPAAAGTR